MISPLTLADWKRQLFEEFKKFNYVTALNSDTDADRMAQWAKESPIPLIPSLVIWKGSPPLDAVRQLVKAGKIKGIGEIAVQYDGLAPNDPFLDPYYALAEEYDLPVSIHIASGAPGIDYIGYHAVNTYRSDLTRPLLLEEVLRKYPKLRIYVMHAGWPMDDEMLLLMFMHPQVYVDIAMINTVLPRKEFHRYLKILVEAGMGKRIMFGTDHAVWPQTIGESVRALEYAPFLSEEQKRDIFFNNAVRFFRLDGNELLKQFRAGEPRG
jgi:predicted TIM-barrel fold metal-dependent hydrolase